MPDLLGVLQTAATMTDRVLVAFSGGKDSVVTLDLCVKHFATVQPFFMYHVPGLSFQDRELAWAEQKYGVEIIRLPHFDTARLMATGAYNAAGDQSVAKLKITDIYDHLRKQTGIHWISAGERIADSIVRRAMIVKSGTIDAGRGRIYPVAHWRKAHVLAYIKTNNLRVSEEARILGHSFRDLRPAVLYAVKQQYPADYEKIIAMYPFAEAGVKWWEMYGADKEAAKRAERAARRGKPDLPPAL
jgi:phosphoadenosine phosphosulfate reductase